MSSPKGFLGCPHHRCSKCSKDRASAGGLLFPCNSCPQSFCEDCLPKKGVTFLEGVERFDELGFDSTKNVVYIHCSPICDNYARAELGYQDPPTDRAPKTPLDLSYNFGAFDDMDTLQAEVAENEEKKLAQGRRLRDRNPNLGMPPEVDNRIHQRPVEKLCPSTLAVLELFESTSAAARSVSCYQSKFAYHINHYPHTPFEGFLWRYSSDGSQSTLEATVTQPPTTIGRNSVASLPVMSQKGSSPITVSDESSYNFPTEIASGNSADSPISID